MDGTRRHVSQSSALLFGNSSRLSRERSHGCPEGSSSSRSDEPREARGKEKPTTSGGSDDSCPRECQLGASPTSHGSDSANERRPPKAPVTCTSLKGNARFWRLLSLLGALPTVLITTLVVKTKEEEASKQPRPPYIPVDYMYRRTKRFPWGDGNHTLFHNPIYNPVPPHGYEVDDPNEIKTSE